MVKIAGAEKQKRGQSLLNFPEKLFNQARWRGEPELPAPLLDIPRPQS